MNFGFDLTFERVCHLSLKKVMQKYILTTLIPLIFLIPHIADAGTIIRPVMNSGLVGYWDFQEGAGDKAYDKSGNGNHGTLTNMDPNTDWVDGQIGQALDFDGSDDYVDCGSDSSITNINDEFTGSAWIHREGGDEGDRVISIRDDSNNRGYILSGKGVEFFESTGNKHDLVNDSWAALNEWYHIVAVKEDTETQSIIKIYKNGELLDSVSETKWDIGSSDDSAIMGSDPCNSLHLFNGQIDEVRIYNRALSDSEIERLYKFTKPKIKAPTRDGLVGYWSMDEGTGTHVGDMSGNGNHGTMQNMDPATDWVAGKYGQALDFDGSDDYVQVSDDNSLDGMNELSISFWAYFDSDLAGSYGTWFRTILSKGNHSSQDYGLYWGWDDDPILQTLYGLLMVVRFV